MIDRVSRRKIVPKKEFYETIEPEEYETGIKDYET